MTTVLLVLLDVEEMKAGLGGLEWGIGCFVRLENLSE